MIPICFVCGESALANQSHHVLPRSRQGTEGPEVLLCANHHQLVHTVAKKMKSGKSGDELLVGMDDVAKSRLLGLVQVILMADLQGLSNTQPMVMAVLDDPAYLVALKLWQKDNGFSSQAAAINAMLRAIAIKYGTIKIIEKSGKLHNIKDLKQLD